MTLVVEPGRDKSTWSGEQGLWNICFAVGNVSKETSGINSSIAEKD